MSRTIGWIAALVLLAALGARADDGQPADKGSTDAKAAAKPATARAESGDFVVDVEREGRVDAPKRLRLRVSPEAFGGPLEVVEVVKEGGPVARGDVVLRLDQTRLEEELRGARQGLEEAKLRLETLRVEQRLLAGEDATRLDRAERARALAEQAVMLFEKFQGPKMLRSAELDVKGRENGLEGQKEELAQLEKMYQGTRLASDTKEIVVERARRAVELSEAWLAIARDDQTVARDYEHPNRQRQVRDELRWASEELDRARETTRIAEARKAGEVESAALALRQAEERVGKLEADRDRLVVRAPEAGILTSVDLAPGDVLSARQPFAQIVPAGRLVVRFEACGEDLRAIEVGKKVRIAAPEIPEVALAGTVAEVGAIGSEAKEGTRFPVTVALGETPAQLRIGLKVTVSTELVVAAAISVPRSAVRLRGGRATCIVRTASGADETREVTLGAATAKRVQVVAGIAAGDVVVLDAPEPGEGEKHPAAEKTGVRAPAPAPSSGAAIERPDAASSTLSRPLAEAVVAASSVTPAEAYVRGVAFLVRTQNDDGSWGWWESSRPDEIYLGTIASHHAFREATTALCALALDEPARHDRAAAAALERGVTHLVAAEPAARATGDTFYDTWTHAYLLTAMARFARDERFAAKRDAIRAVARREIALIAEHQGADGGFGYYDFGYSLETPTGNESTSFLTAVTLLALHDARDAGLEVPEAVIADALSCLERLRLPSGAYIYGTYAEMRPGVLFNRVNGSLGRSQPCNLALRLFGRDITTAEILAGIENLENNHHFIEIGKDRPYPHEAWYYTAGYYFLFGHYYAARAIATLDGPAQAPHREWLARTMARLQDPDGSWFDFPFYGYHKQYGTAFAVMTLRSCLGAHDGTQ